MQIEKGSNHEVSVNRFSFLLLDNKKQLITSLIFQKMHKAHISEASCVYLLWNVMIRSE